ncbi:MAG: hypothetical protein M1829_005434 [Trizodia sp. TS-e1964]|nr:MAG: hypothetical protein M1829_005434 [Trizodia sp. TS-e1964]
MQTRVEPNSKDDQLRYAKQILRLCIQGKWEPGHVFEAGPQIYAEFQLGRAVASWHLTGDIDVDALDHGPTKRKVEAFIKDGLVPVNDWDIEEAVGMYVASYPINPNHSYTPNDGNVWALFDELQGADYSLQNSADDGFFNARDFHHRSAVDETPAGWLSLMLKAMNSRRSSASSLPEWA